MSRRRAALALGVTVLLAATFLSVTIDPSAASTSDETEDGLVIPPGGEIRQEQFMR